MSLRLLITLALAALGVAGCTVHDDSQAAPAGTQRAAELVGDVCVSTTHETSNVDGVFSFDLTCAVDWLVATGCDFDLDPSGDGTTLRSSTLEDMFNDPAGCSAGLACTGCSDADSLATVTSCHQMASFAYFTGSAWEDMQAQCPVLAGPACSGGSWGPITLDPEQECDVLEVANHATLGQLTTVSTWAGVVTPSAGLPAAQAEAIAPPAVYIRSYATIDEVLALPAVDHDALADLRDFVPAWVASGRMGDPDVDPEQRLLAFANAQSVTADEIDWIGDVSAVLAGEIVDGRPWSSGADLVAVAGAPAQAGGSLHDYAIEWYGMQAEEAAGCTIEGVDFTGSEMSCAVQLFLDMDCDSCRSVFDTRICEDAINDPAACHVGAACTGCSDGDSRDNGVDCDEIAAYSYFGASAASALLGAVQATPCDAECTPDCGGRVCGDDGCGGSCGSCGAGETCSEAGVCAADGCVIEGTDFDEAQMQCALSLFETMDCDLCTSLFDSRVCEDAINDPAECQRGFGCTGCSDADTRADGVDCAEVAAYSYFGSSAGQALHAWVQADPTCGAPQIVCEGIPLTAEEAGAILDCVNGATVAQLDDEAGLDGRAAENIVAAQPIASLDELAAISYVGQTAISSLRDYATSWLAPDTGPVTTSVQGLVDEIAAHGESSAWFGGPVMMPRAIITSDPWTSSGGNTMFQVADPFAGALEQITVYVPAAASVDLAFASIHDDVAINGTFTRYNSTWEVVVEDPASHSVALNTSGLAWQGYDSVQASWPSTAANPEGAVRVISTWDYTYLVPLPLFLDHPMWGGNPPGAPSDSQGQDINWNIAANQAIQAWSP